MSALRSISLAAAVAAVTISAFVETPFAQNSDVRSDPDKLMQPEAAPDPASVAAIKKADEAMTVAPSPAPLTDADRRAAAAMERASNPAPSK